LATLRPFRLVLPENALLASRHRRRRTDVATSSAPGDAARALLAHSGSPEPHAEAEALDAGAARNDTGTRVRAVRHLRRAQAPRRRDRALGISRAPQAPARSEAARLDVVGTARSRLVDGGAVRRRLVPLRAGNGARVRGRRG